MNFGDLERKIKDIDRNFDLSLIKSAYEFAKNKHQGQKRLTGDDYITHPLSVALILADIGLDEVTISAALLHDVLEDTDTKKEDLLEEFGEKITELVEGVTKLGTIDFSRLPDNEKQIAKAKAESENLRKFFLAMANDIRVVIIKLADRLHNMRTLDALCKNDQKRISRETLEIFAPLADRLGMGSIKAELEDLSFKYLYPKEFVEIEKFLSAGKKERSSYLDQIKKVIILELKKEGIEAEVDGRVKHMFSIYNKVQKYDGDYSKIYDLLAVRVVVDNIEDCYKALGIIHKNYKPLIYRIKDYIAVPKPNGYQSLHTTVFGVGGRITEIQIRTKEMHEEAEKGVAAHWYYSENKSKTYSGGDAKTSNINWVNKIMDWQKNITSDDEFSKALKIDLFSDRIFVFSPKGEVFDLPDGATPIDFAYEIHSEIGNRCRGAKVNGRIVTLDYRLENRDVVEIVLAPKNDKSGPNRNWLDFVKTAKSRQNIRSYYKKLNRDENIEAGKKLFLNELSLLGMSEGDLTEDQKRELINDNSWKNWDDVLAAIGEGTTTARQVIKKIIGQKIYIQNEEKTKVPEVVSESERDSYTNLAGILVRYAACCNPKAGDDIKGFITQGQGITIHKTDCPNLLASQKEKIINVDFDIPKTAIVRVEITGANRVGFIHDLSAVISNLKVNINQIQNEHSDDEKISLVLVDLAIDDTDKLTEILHKLTNVEGVVRVRKR